MDFKILGKIEQPENDCRGLRHPGTHAPAQALRAWSVAKAQGICWLLVPVRTPPVDRSRVAKRARPIPAASGASTEMAGEGTLL